MGLGRIAAHDQQRLGVADVVVAVGHRAVAPGIGYARDRGRMADARLVVDVVGAPEGGELAEQIGALVGELGGAEPVDRLRSRAAADGGELVTDLVDRLLPAHPRPLAVDELHRIFQPPVAMHELAHGRAFDAMRAAIERRFPPRLLADPHPVGDLRHHGAADRAVGADVLADGDLGARSRRRTRLRLAHARERKRSERGKSAGREAGAAQERAAIEGAAGLALQGAGERAAAGRAFRSLDQHGALPQLGYRLTR